MEETIQILDQFIVANRATKDRTPWLDLALGGLITARDCTRCHLAHAAQAQDPANAGRQPPSDFP